MSMAQNNTDLAVMRRIVDYLVQNQPAPQQDITKVIDLHRTTVASKLQRMEDKGVLFKKINASPKPDEPRHYWQINPEKARESEIVRDEHVEEIVEEQNSIIDELASRDLLQNPEFGPEAKEFLEKMIEKGEIDLKKKELDEENHGLTPHAYFTFMELWMNAVKSIDGLRIEGQLSAKRSDRPDNEDIHEDALHLLNDELLESIDQLPEPKSRVMESE